jgi:serine phosphatase RsbU (regulator of sigma subunit)
MTIADHLIKQWKKVTLSGIRSAKTPHDRKSLLLINRLSMLNTLLMVFFSVMGIVLDLSYVLYFCIPFGIAFALPPYLNSLGKFEFSRYYFSIIPLFFLLAACIHNSDELGDRFLVLSTAAIPLILFKERWKINLLFSLNVAVFFFVSWYQAHYEPMERIPFYIAERYQSGALFAIFIILYFVVQYFRNDCEDYERELEDKNYIITQKNSEIIDSINYARRLQSAVMPPVEDIYAKLRESFILYKPKDIVAGDFYFAEQRDDYFFVAAADCTGHGVPGAMMSMVCSNALNRAVNDMKLTSPGEILDKVTEIVVETFARSHEDVKDGMDISLCVVNTRTGEIAWAGANNPLWYIEDPAVENLAQINEITADKQPVGKHDFYKPFTTHLLKLKKGSLLYLFTDGYADQFGGLKGKKFKYKQLKELIFANRHLNMTNQKEMLERTFDSWKGEIEQVDDVCIIGLRL